MNNKHARSDSIVIKKNHIVIAVIIMYLNR